MVGCSEERAVRHEIRRVLRGMEERRWQEAKAEIDARYERKLLANANAWYCEGQFEESGR